MRVLSPLALCSLAAAQSTWIVDDSGGPGVHFTSLPAAVAAAASGDTLLVAAGNYQAFHVANKALTILGAGPSLTVISSSAPAPTIGNAVVYLGTPPPGSTFRLSGFRVEASPSPSTGSGIAAEGNANSGTIVLCDVTVAPTSTSPTAALTVSGIEVHAARCGFTGGNSGAPQFGIVFGFDGAKVIADGRLVATDCRFVGGTTPTFGTTVLAAGGKGLAVDNSKAWLWSSSVQGGGASSGTVVGTTSAGSGLVVTNGASVRVCGAASDILRGGNASGGQPNGGIGILSSAGCTVEVCGPVAVSGGTAFPSGSGAPVAGPGVSLGLPARPRTRLTGTPTQPLGGDLDGNASVTLRLQAAPNQFALLFVHERPAVIALPGLSDDPLLVPPDAFVVFAGALDANGDYAFAFTPAVQAPILLDVPLHFQGCVFDAASGLWLGSNAEIRRIR